MKARAAIAWAAGQPLDIEQVEVAPPRQGEVLVRLIATGVCHTDAYTLSGRDPEGVFPAILGHEGGGIVEDIGPGVTTLRPGDLLERELERISQHEHDALQRRKSLQHGHQREG